MGARMLKQITTNPRAQVWLINVLVLSFIESVP